AKFKVDKACIRIIRDHSFFATLLLGLERAPDPGCGTMWTDGKWIGYDPEFVERTAPGHPRTALLDKLVGAIAHEIYHVFLLHPIRLAELQAREGAEFDAALANDAADYSI